MNLECWIIKSDGTLKNILLPEDMVLTMMKELREEDETYIYFSNSPSVKVEGLYVSAKGTRVSVVALPMDENV